MAISTIDALYHSGSEKLTTTGTGIDVTGTVTSDGLTVTQTGSTTATIGATGTSGDNDGTLIINNGGTGDGMLRFDYESNTDRARIGVSASSQNLQFYTAGNNERMKIDSSGRVTKPAQPYFYVRAASTSLGVNDYTTVVINNEINDVGGNFSGNVFTAPVTGVYSLTFNARLDSLKNNGSYYNFNISTSNNTYSQLFSTGGFDQNVNYWVFTMNVIADMDAGDTSSCSINQQGGSSGTSINTSTAFFGYLLG